MDWDAALTRANSGAEGVFSDPGAGIIGPEAMTINSGLRFDPSYLIHSALPGEGATYRWMVDTGDGWNYVSGSGATYESWYSDDPAWQKRYCRVSVKSSGSMLFSNVCTITDIAFENEPPKGGTTYSESFDGGTYRDDFVFRRKFNTFGPYFYGEDYMDRYNGNYAFTTFTIERAMDISFYVQTYIMPCFKIGLEKTDYTFYDEDRYYDEEKRETLVLVNEDELDPQVTYRLEPGEYRVSLTGIRIMNYGIINDLIYFIMEGKVI
ncbi:MAG: hypothetical protein LUE10_04070 [Alistipes sp.]|nr:hypothetical protein [Alistipes sp.]